ncbi:MAG TPA: uracil-DNA glycosylase [Gammaproteobacteria bacterium]|nr:uracil-DNA glycosylase [Gammaproteobacteria bacterium]
MSSREAGDSRDRRLRYLDAMGIQAWETRVPAAETEPASVPEESDAGAVATPSPAAVAQPPPADVAGVETLDWEALQARVQSCTRCELHRSRTHTVFGVGDRQADWLVIGEAPGRDEDLQGEPFVGRAGQLLNAMLLAVGLRREQVYIANILKCRPPNNRDPRPEEVLACEPYLLRQIELIRPRLILAVGRIAAQNLLQTDTPIGKLRGRVHRFRDSGIPLIATYHPAYLLRSPLEKRKAWQDLQLAVKTLKEAGA